MDDAQIKHMVDRFLMWKVPADFSPDGGVKFDPHRDAGGGFHRPIGTNILTATQAEAMIRHMLERLPAEDSAAAFDKADFFWRTLDPDDSGDNPSEALARGMVGSYTVCEVASSFTGPVRYGFTAPVLADDSDDEEFLHFATKAEAMSAAGERLAAITAKEAKMDKQHGFTGPGTAPAYANVTLIKRADSNDHQNDDRVVLTVRSAGTPDGSTGPVAFIEMTRREFIDFVEGGRETLQP